MRVWLGFFYLMSWSIFYPQFPHDVQHVACYQTRLPSQDSQASFVSALPALHPGGPFSQLDPCGRALSDPGFSKVPVKGSENGGGLRV